MPSSPANSAGCDREGGVGAGRQRSPDASTSKLRHCRSVRILEGLDRIPYTGNVMSCRRVLSLLLLAAWVLIGPMAIAFGGCAATAASCHLACTPLACPTVVQAMAPEALAALTPQPESTPVTVEPVTPEPPPKSLLAAA